MSRNLRVGLMGGSFDPIHIGHVRIASEARKALDLDRVLFLPSGRPPHKAHLGASAAQRLEMTKLATQGLPWAEASDIEVFREGTIYTVDTLTILTAQHPETDFYYIIGADTLLDLPNWRNTKKVCTMCRFICVRRPGIDSRRMDLCFRAWAFPVPQSVSGSLPSRWLRQKCAPSQVFSVSG